MTKIKVRVCSDELERQAFALPNKSSKFLPEWYRKLPRVTDRGLDEGGTVKRCVPFAEAMAAGLTIPMWADLKINVYQIYKMFSYNDEFLGDHEDVNHDGADFLIGKDHNITGKKVVRYELGDVNFQMAFHPTFQIKAGRESYGRHSNGQVGEQFTNELYCKNIMKLHSPWVLIAPKGYSAFFKPYPNSNVPLRIFEGLVDVDNYKSFVNFPFYWSGTETGTFTIKKGTPIAQVLFLPQKGISVDHVDIDPDQVLQTEKLLSSQIDDSYRHNFWHKMLNRDLDQKPPISARVRKLATTLFKK